MRSLTVFINDRRHAVISKDDGTLTLEGEPVRLEIAETDRLSYSVVLNGRPFRILACRNGDSYLVLLGGSQHQVTVESERSRLIRHYSQSSATTHHRLEIHAPMPALVVRVEVQPGDQVTAGQGIIILEAMKMENEIKAHQAGTVKAVQVAKGEAVEKGQLLVLLE